MQIIKRNVKLYWETTRRKVFWWIAENIFKQKHNCVKNKPTKVLFFIFFPLFMIKYFFREGYNYLSNTWNIYGVEYPDDFFKRLSSLPTGQELTFKKLDNKLVEVTKHENGVNEETYIEKCK